MYVVSPSSTTTPGAHPTGLCNTFAPSGNSAFDDLHPAMVRFYGWKNVSTSSIAS